MLKRWIFYLAVLLGCAVFWVAHQGWTSWLLFRMVVWLPWLSLALSLLPMLSLQPGFNCPRQLEIGADEKLELSVKSRFPLPPYRCQLQLRHSLTGASQTFKAGQPLPTGHCGALAVSCHRFYVYDFLGLFRLPLTRLQELHIRIRPVPIAMDVTRELERFLAHAWQPKPGGGFAENHELRLYRPGDSLNQIHWKLTAKTGKLTIREPMIPRHGRILVTLDITGTADVLDRKMGQLLWLGRRLLDLGLNFEIHALSGEGIQVHPITDEPSFDKAMDQLLCCTPASEGSARNPRVAASWHFHIGGEQDEI